MTEAVHKYHCRDCRIFIFGETPVRLAENLNSHNRAQHPMNSDRWTANDVTRSSHYAGPSQSIVPMIRKEYTTPYGTTPRSGDWGDAKNPPDITAEDLAMLAEWNIGW